MNRTSSSPIGILEILWRVHRVGRKMHPALTLGAAKHQVLLWMNAATHISTLRHWYGAADNPLRTLALNRFPLIEGAIYWPYINHTWTMAKRLDVIDRHYRMLGDKASILAEATVQDVELARCDVQFPGLRLVLEKAPWFLREGEMVLSIFVADERVYSVAFTLGMEAGQPMVYVGALQGRNLDNVMEIYRNMTHALHGMRPRDFLLAALKLLSAAIGNPTIWGVSSEYRQHNGRYFAGSHQEKLVADYDEVWTEQGGTVIGNGFSELSATIHYKDISEIPTRKRANYKRRYAMLEKLTIDINLMCERSRLRRNGTH
jgi:uncharacterized protein